MKRAPAGPLALLAAAAWVNGAAAAVSYEGGVGVATGRYFFEERTTTGTLLTGLALSTGRISVKGVLPLVLQDTRLVTASGAGAIPSGGPMSGAVADSGGGGRGMPAPRAGPVPASGRHRVPVAASAMLPGGEARVGDPVLQLAWRAAGSRRVTASIGAAVKAPLADTTDFGTGEWDFGALASAAVAAGRRWSFGVDASWWRLGDLPDLDLRDPVTASLSAMRRVAPWAATAFVTAGTSPVRGYDPPVALGAGAVRSVGRSSVGFQFSIGLTETAAGLSAGVQWSVPLQGG